MRTFADNCAGDNRYDHGILKAVIMGYLTTGVMRKLGSTVEKLPRLFSCLSVQSTTVENTSTNTLLLMSCDWW